MKKLIVIIYTILYAFLSVGIAASAHYCMGDLVGVELTSMEQAEACCADEGASCDGCASEYHFIKLLIEQEGTPRSVDVCAPVFHVACTLYDLHAPSLITEIPYVGYLKFAKAPPNRWQGAIHTHYCQFLI